VSTLMASVTVLLAPPSPVAVTCKVWAPSAKAAAGWQVQSPDAGTVAAQMAVPVAWSVMTTWAPG
jgi:hypothetical protein